MNKNELKKEVIKLSKDYIIEHPLFNFVFDKDIISFKEENNFGCTFSKDYEIIQNIECLINEMSLFLASNNLNAEDDIDLLLINFDDRIYIK